MKNLSDTHGVGGVAPTRQQINQWMAEAGWQNSAIRQADLECVERVVRVAVAALGVTPAHAPQRFIVSSIKHKAGIVTLVTINADDVQSPLESGQVVTLALGVPIPLNDQPKDEK